MASYGGTDTSLSDPQEESIADDLTIVPLEKDGFG